MRQTPEFTAHRSALRYDAASGHLVHSLKYYDQPTHLPLLSLWLERNFQQLAQTCAAKDEIVIAPVPLHRWRLWKRKYNQSALLALALAKRVGRPCIVDALLRTKHRPPQASLNRKKRLLNMRGAFSVNIKRQHHLEGKTIILVDDVMTTGATLNACAKALKRCGAKQVLGLTLARTVLE